MKEAIQNAFIHNFQTMLNSHVEPVNPLLVLHINRQSIVQDTINQVKHLPPFLFFLFSDEISSMLLVR